FEALANEAVGKLFAEDPEKVVELFEKIKRVTGGDAWMAFKALANEAVGKLFAKDPEKVVGLFEKINKVGSKDAWMAFEALDNEAVRKLFAEDPEKVIRAFEGVVRIASEDAEKVFEALVYREVNEGELDFFIRLAGEADLRNRLKEEFNIDFIMRYPGGVLEDMLSGRRDPARPLAIIAYPKYDHNRAFYFNKIWQLYRAGFQVVVFESGNEGEFKEWMKRIVAKWGPADVVVLGGHGKPQEIRLGAGESEENFLDVTDGDVLKALKPLVKPGGMFVLDSCSTGDSKTTDNIAQVISGSTGTIVFAPERPTAISNFNIQYDENWRPVLDSVDYFGPTWVYKKGKRQD
ncbi:MAG: hypothetical protein QXH27_02275, partial [Candidatus Micrarchaeia archaeon]